jgi:hypothetical protein
MLNVSSDARGGVLARPTLSAARISLAQDMDERAYAETVERLKQVNEAG